MELSTEDVIAERELVGIHGDTVHVPDPTRTVHLQFRRFAGCPLCNLHLRSVVRRYDEIVNAGIVEVAVFHSEVDAMQLHLGDLPFPVVSDPERTLYTEFGVESSPRAVLHPGAWTGPLKPYAWKVGMRERRALNAEGRLTRGEDMLGLPADFLIAPDGRLLAAKYGRHANDQWSVDEMLGIRTASVRS